MGKIYTEKQLQDALNNLQEKLPDQDEKNGYLSEISNGAIISKDFTRKCLKRVHVTDCQFIKSIFKAVAGVGSRFVNVKFMNCDFTGSNFQYCHFSNTYFTDKSMAKGANFSHSIFIECVFDNIKIRECTFFDCQFHNCTFLSSAIRSITLENSIFYHCNIQSINLAHINLEYTRFSDVTMKNVTLPPYQIAYIIGGPAYLLTTSDKVYIHTDHGKITVNQYNNLLNDLEKYYYYQKDFFPLANIMIALAKYNMALDYIDRGIREAFDYSDFRMVKHYCRLAISCKGFSHTQLKFLYELITDLSYKKELNINELHSYFLNIGEIRELLLNGAENKECVEFVIKTDIDKNDLPSINNLYNEINHILNEYCSAEHIDSIELRHNSPFELLITCIDSLPSIIKLIPVMYGMLSVGSKALDLFERLEIVRKTHEETSLLKVEQRMKELEIQEKEQEILSQKKDIQRSNTTILTISEIEHSLKCSTPLLVNNFAPEYLHYKYVRDIRESK